MFSRGLAELVFFNDENALFEREAAYLLSSETN